MKIRIVLIRIQTGITLFDSRLGGFPLHDKLLTTMTFNAQGRYTKALGFMSYIWRGVIQTHQSLLLDKQGPITGIRVTYVATDVALREGEEDLCSRMRNWWAWTCLFRVDMEKPTSLADFLEHILRKQIY